MSVCALSQLNFYQSVTEFPCRETVFLTLILISYFYFLILTPSECHRTNCYRKRHQDLGLCQLVRGYTTAVGCRAPSAVPSPTSGSQQLCLECHYFSHSLMLLRNSLSELYTAVWMRRVRLRSPSDSKDSRCGEVSLHRLANPKTPKWVWPTLKRVRKWV